METNQNKNSEEPVDSMSTEKTNEDFNNRQPDLNDPNQKKQNPNSDGYISENIKREINAKTANLKTDVQFYDEEFDESVYKNPNIKFDNLKREEKSDDARNEANPENESANQ